MPDRFADGDLSNNVPKGAAPGTYDRQAAKAYHGGDLKGIQNHLAYLKDLGITTIWLNPIVDNDNVSETYHGYGAIDLYAVEDHFGTLQQFQQLVGNAHHGIKILLDMVPNTLGRIILGRRHSPRRVGCTGTTANQCRLRLSADDGPTCGGEEELSQPSMEWFANILPDLAQKIR